MQRGGRLPGDSGSASELGQALPFSLPVTRFARPSSLPLVFLKDLERRGENCQDGSSGSKEVMNVLVRVFLRPGRLGAS